MHQTPHRLIEALLTTDNATVYWKIRRRYVLDCARCKPHGGMDNPWSRHPHQDRYKHARRRTFGRFAIRTIRDPRFWEVHS